MSDQEVREALRLLERHGVRLVEYPTEIVVEAMRTARDQALLWKTLRSTALENDGPAGYDEPTGDDPGDGPTCWDILRMPSSVTSVLSNLTGSGAVLGAYLGTLETLAEAASEPIFHMDLRLSDVPGHPFSDRDSEDTQESSVGPISLNWTMARKWGWTEDQLQRTAMILAQLSRREGRIAAHRQGRTVTCFYCECWVPPEGCDLGCRCKEHGSYDCRICYPDDGPPDLEPDAPTEPSGSD